MAIIGDSQSLYNRWRRYLSSWD